MLTFLLIILGLYLIIRYFSFILWVGVFIGLSLVFVFVFNVAISFGFDGNIIVKAFFGIIFILLFFYAIAGNIFSSVIGSIGKLLSR